jgi:hypothetical protein
MTTGIAFKKTVFTLLCLFFTNVLFGQQIETNCFEKHEDSEYEINRFLSNEKIRTKLSLNHITKSDVRRLLVPEEINTCAAIENAGIDTDIANVGLYRRDVFKARDRFFLVYTVKNPENVVKENEDGSISVIKHTTLITILNERLVVLESFRFH